MARYARLVPPDSVQHVIARFVDREFRLDAPGARAEYLARLAHALARTDWRLLAFGLMSSHVHLCMLAGRVPPARVFQPAHSGFARWLNDVTGRLGPVFADRYRTITVAPSACPRALAYVHNNPPRARVVADAGESDWTSHRAYLGEAPAPAWLDVARGLALCGYDASPAGRRGFDAWVRAQRDEPRDVRLGGRDLSEQRAAVRRALGTPLEVGTSRYEGEHAAAIVSLVGHRAGPLRPRWDGDVRDVVARVVAVTGVTATALRTRSRRSEVVEARRLALVTWNRHLGRTQIEMATALGIGAPGASMLLNRATARVDDLEGLARRLAQECWAAHGAEMIQLEK